MIELKYGKQYWIKQKYLEFAKNGNNRPLKFVDAEGSFHWYKEGLEPVEVIPEREKVVIPNFVAEWIVGCREHGYDFAVTLDEGVNESPAKVQNWLLSRKNQDTFARAWLDGYEVEEEPLYWVRSKEGISLLYKADSSIVPISASSVKHQEEHSEQYTFTEKEIKDYDERYWAFAVPVEEDDE